jgi:single-strand DNA-binding protein
MALPLVFVEGGLVADPELAYSQGGKAWARCRLVAKDRVRGDNGQWQDGDATFIDLVCFGKQAENLMESCSKGDTIVAQGRLKQREYEVDGQKRTSYQIVADSVAVALTWHPAIPDRADAAHNVSGDAWGGGQSDAAPF